MAKLYEDQQLASDKCMEWIDRGMQGERFAGLWASAGYGKSYTVKYIIEQMMSQFDGKYMPVLCSMTHSAVDVLAEMSGMPVSTLHGLFKWVPSVDKETGEEYLSTPQMRGDTQFKSPLLPNSILVVDEGGLMGHDELALLEEELEKARARVLFVGDHKQCYPVVKDDQELCVPAYDVTQVMMELTIPKRVDKGDMIYALSQAMRKTVDGARQPRLRTILNKDGSGKGVRHVDDIEEYAVKAFEAGVRDGDTTNIKVLAFTNERCVNLNRKIRKQVLGLKQLTPVVGERMVANSSITNSTGDEVLIKNNEQVIVKEVEATESHGLAGAFVQYADLDGNDIEEIVFVPASPNKLRDRLKALSNDAQAFRANGFEEDAKDKWRSFFSLKESVADIRYTYAMTVNKCQGVTLKHALVDMWDINACHDREQKARLAYTAITRATDYVTIEGELDE